MKRFFSILSLMLMMVFITPDTEARKFGGGKSFGKSYKTAPAPSSTPTNTGSINKQNDRNPNQGAPSQTQGSKKGFLGGMFGGLLAGGLLAALFAGGAFEGFQFADFFLIAAFALSIFLIVKAMKARKHRARQSYATAGGFENNKKAYYHERANAQAQYRTSEQSGFANSHFNHSSQGVPFNYPPNFDHAAFLKGACEHYRILQEAWNKNQLNTIQEYVSIELYNELARERASLDAEQFTDVMYVNAEIVRADHDNQKAELSLQFNGRYRDVQEGIEEDIKDIWHLERSLTQHNAPWLIVGIEG